MGDVLADAMWSNLVEKDLEGFSRTEAVVPLGDLRNPDNRTSLNNLLQELEGNGDNEGWHFTSQMVTRALFIMAERHELSPTSGLLPWVKQQTPLVLKCLQRAKINSKRTPTRTEAPAADDGERQERSACKSVAFISSSSE